MLVPSDLPASPKQVKSVQFSNQSIRFKKEKEFRRLIIQSDLLFETDNTESQRLLNQAKRILDNDLSDDLRLLDVYNSREHWFRKTILNGKVKTAL